MKKTIIKLVLLFLIILSCFSAICMAEGVYAFEQKEYTVALGKSLSVKPVSQGISGWLSCSWSSEDSSIAKVSAQGYVTPVSEGTTTITCVGKASDGTEHTASYDLTVFVPVQRITTETSQIELAASSASSLKGLPEEYLKFFEYTPELTFYPENATYKTVQWSSSIPNVKVDSNGKISVEEGYIGNATVTGKATDGSNATVRINVTIPKVLTTEKKLVISTPETAEIGLIVNLSGFVQYGTYDNPYAIFQGDRYSNGIIWAKIQPLKAGQTSLAILENGYQISSVPIVVEHSAVYDNVSYPPRTVEQIISNPQNFLDTQTQLKLEVVDIMERKQDNTIQKIYVAKVQSSSNSSYVGFIAPKKTNIHIGDKYTVYGTISEIFEISLETGLKYEAPLLDKVHLEQ